MVITEILKKIYDVASQIYTQVNLVKANEEQCKTLVKRISIVREAIKQLENTTTPDRYMATLMELQACFQNCFSFIHSFCQENWLMQVINAGSANKKFSELSGRLHGLVQILNLGIDAQQLINHEKDKADQKADLAKILSLQENNLLLQQEAKKLLHEVKLQEADHHAIVMQRVDSIKNCLDKFKADKEKPKPLIDKSLSIPFYQLKFERKLVDGPAGKIWLGRHHEQMVAIKTLGHNYTSEELLKLSREVKVMSRIRDKNMVQLYGACLEAYGPCLVMEYCEKGSLRDLLLHEKFSLPHKHSIALEIARGLCYLHQREMIHRNLNTSHILIGAHGEAKMTGFGLSKIARAESILTIKQPSITQAGQAPECCLPAGVHTPQSDIYSYGIVICELMTGKNPLADCKSEAELLQRILTGKWEIPKTIPATFQEIISRCCRNDPLQRPSANELVHILESFKPQREMTADDYYLQGRTLETQGQSESARDAYEKAAGSGHMKACTNLAYLLTQGKGGPMDKVRAFHLFSQAANHGHTRAMVNVGVMLENGEGVPMDPAKALERYEQAEKQGDQEAAKKSQALRNRLFNAGAGPGPAIREEAGTRIQKTI